MKLVSYSTPTTPERVGILHDNRVFDLSDSGRKLGLSLPATIAELLAGEQPMMSRAHEVHRAVREGELGPGLDSKTTRLLAPVPHPTSCRDGYAFRQHVATARRNRGLDMIPEFDEFPVFYFTNHLGIVGPGDIVVEADHLQKLDFELEAAIVIGHRGRNIQAKEADQFIAGYTIMNDLSARVLQMEEMKLSLGPAKGKDFATAIGPWLVTPDELASYRTDTPSGFQHDLRMTAYHNGALVSDGNLNSMNWTFAELIERASYGVELLPGDIMGSGTVGTGCYLELNGTRALEAKARGASYEPVWLKAGDTIKLEITGLGRLTNCIVKAPGEYSILAKKKTATTA